MALFTSSWSQAAREAEQAAVREVEELDRGTLSDPDLAGILDRIADHFSLKVAVLQPQAKRTMRRDAQRPAGESGGIMDVKIPFQGDPISFQLAPADCTIPSLPCDVRSDLLFISLPDDSDVERNVDQFAQQVAKVLEALRAEVAAWHSQLRGVLETAASAKINQIASEEDDDGTLGSPVD
jgi:hypothetical protein